MYLYLKPILVLKIRRAVSQNKILSQDYMKVYSYKLANEQMWEELPINFYSNLKKCNFGLVTALHYFLAYSNLLGSLSDKQKKKDRQTERKLERQQKDNNTGGDRHIDFKF